MTLFLVAAVISDLKTDRIPNFYILVGITAGVLLTFLNAGLISVSIHILQFVILFFFLWPLYQLQGLGAGDCKVLLAASMFVPTNAIFYFVFTAFIFGAILGIAKYIVPRCKSKGKIHFTVPILMSTLCYITYLHF